jgi:glycosyltransferase involved in cell wall biosynthesis
MSTQKPRITVLIATYNRARELPAALDSVLRQTYTDWEILLIDDGSSDNTCEVARSYAAGHHLDESRFRYLYQENQGKSAAMNRGIQIVRTDWVAFLDSDDVFLPEKLELQWQALREYGSEFGACFTDARYVNAQGVLPTIFDRVQRKCYRRFGKLTNAVDLVIQDLYGVPIQSVLMRMDVFPQVGEFDPHLRIAEDRDFIYRLAWTTSLCYVNQPLVEIDRTPGRSVGQVELLAKIETSLEQHLYVYRKWLNSGPPISEARKSAIERRIQLLHSEMVNRYLAVGDFKSAKKQAELAYRAAPNLRFGTKWLLAVVAPGITRRLSLNAINKTNG